MGKRTPLTAADLFVLLDREFGRRKPKTCDTCFVQLPFRVDARNGDANWEVLLPEGCRAGCEAVLDEIVHELQGAYELQESSGTERV